jgi:hypothetical protein
MLLRGKGQPGNLVKVEGGPFGTAQDSYLPADVYGDIILESVTAIPEPSTLSLILCSALALVYIRLPRNDMR